MAETTSKTVRDLRRALYLEAYEVYKEWRAGRDEALDDGWAYYCRHGFHDNAEGLCGPCEMGADGFFWNWREEIKAADNVARDRADKMAKKFSLAMKVLGFGDTSEELRSELSKWIGQGMHWEEDKSTD